MSAHSIVWQQKCLDCDATLRELKFADEFEYNSSKVCLDGTQKELIGEIMDWCGNVDLAQMALLTAVAGAGKSTIAHTIAHSCAKCHNRFPQIRKWT